MFRISALVLTASALWLGTSARADEDKAVAFVKKLGGVAVRDENAPGKPVTELILLHTKVTDADLKVLAGLKSITKLNLFRAYPITS